MTHPTPKPRGRPRGSKNATLKPATVMLFVRVTSEFRAKFRTSCKRRKIKPGDILRAMMERFIEAEEK